MTWRLRRGEFREYLARNPNTPFLRGSFCSCPLAGFLGITNPRYPVHVTSTDYGIGNCLYLLPAWARTFVANYDNSRLSELGKDAIVILDAIPLGPEDEDDDEHPGRAMLDESPPHDPDEMSPDYDEELEDSETESDYEDDSE